MMTLKIILAIVFFVIFWIIPSLLGTWMLLRILKKDFLPVITKLNIKEDGLSLADLIFLNIFVFSVLFVLFLTWIPAVNFVMLWSFFDYSGDLNLDKMYIIKPRDKQTNSNSDSEYDGIICE